MLTLSENVLLRQEVITSSDRDLLSSLLKIITHKVHFIKDYGLEENLAGLGSGDVTDSLVKVLPGLKMASARALGLHALATWQALWPEKISRILESRIVGELLTTLSKLFEMPTATSPGVYAASIAARMLHDYVKNKTHSIQVLKDIEKHNGVQALLHVCRSPAASPRSICLAIHLLTNMTKSSERLFQVATSNHGHTILCNLLRNSNDADIIKFSALAICRWSSDVEVRVSLRAAGVLERCWNILLDDGHIFERKVCAYVVSAICMIEINTENSIEISERLLEPTGGYLRAFCKGLKCYDDSFKKQGVVHYTLSSVLQGERRNDIVRLAIKYNCLESLGNHDEACRSILLALAEDADLVNDCSSESRLNLGCFLLTKLPRYVDQAKEILFTGKLMKEFMREALKRFNFGKRGRSVATSSTMESSCSSESSECDEAPELSRFRWDSGSLNFENNMSFKGSIVSEKEVDAVCQEEDEFQGEYNLEPSEQLSQAKQSSGAFSAEDKFSASAIILAKLYNEVSSQSQGLESRHLPARSKRQRQCLGQDSEPEVPLRKKSCMLFGETRDTQKTEGFSSLITFQVGGEIVPADRATMREHSAMLASFLSPKGEEGELVITIPEFNSLSGKVLIQAFREVIDWCHLRKTQVARCRGMIENCWLVADYLQMDGLQSHMETMLELEIFSMKDQKDQMEYLNSLAEKFSYHPSIIRVSAKYVIRQLAKLDVDASLYHQQQLNILSPLLERHHERIADEMTTHYKNCFFPIE
eukprot:jgi/Picsp_1/555/NSC_00552-R1_---NA---